MKTSPLISMMGEVCLICITAVIVFNPSPAHACAPGWSNYAIAFDDTPACFVVTASPVTKESMYEPILLTNECTEDIHMEPVEGGCDGCPEAFVLAPDDSEMLIVQGQNAENSYRWWIEDGNSTPAQEGTLLIESISVIPDCPDHMGCGTAARAHTGTTGWLLYPLILAMGWLVRRHQITGVKSAP